MAFPDFAGRNVVVDGTVIRDLRRLAIEGFTKLPRRGIEVGGLLFGQSHGKELRVISYEEAPCEHRYGPSYALSENDRAQLAELLEKRLGGRQAVIGFFRSFTARDPVIEQADEEFVHQRFPAGDFIFLMLQPLSPENCVASLRLFRDGLLLPEEDDPRPAPFNEPAIAAAPPEESRVEPPLLLPPSFRARETQAALATPPATDVEPQPRTRWWIPAAILLGSAAAGAVGYSLRPSTAEPPWTELYLKASSSNGHLEVSWDANTPQVLRATRGVLAETNAATHRDIELGAADLRAGKYLLPAPDGDALVRLILYARTLPIAGDSLQLATIRPPAEAGPHPPAAGSADRSAPAPAAEAAPASRVSDPPQAVHEVQPRIPEGIRSRLNGSVVIPVSVEVSASGRVVSAVAEVETGDSVRRYLAEQAMRAAREWRFTPARTKTGLRVTATKTIDFVFTP